MAIDPITVESVNKFVLYPIDYQDIFDFYKLHLSVFWTVEEVDMKMDRQEFARLSENEQYFIKNVIGFFAASDGIVNFNIERRILSFIGIKEAKVFYQFHQMI